MKPVFDPPDPPLAERLAQLWHDSTTWAFDHSTRIILAAVLGAIIVALLLGARWLGGRICTSDPAHNHWRSVLGKALARTRLWFMVAVAAQVMTRFAHAPSDLASIVNFAFVIATTLQAAVFARELILGTIEYRAVGHESLGGALNIIRILTTVALFAIAMVLILSNLGVNVTGLVAGLGIGGIAIGLAAQGIFKDLFAALSILLDRPFRVHDLIRFGDVLGRVEAIGLKTTRIRSLDGEEVIMSNDKLLDQQIRNYHGIASRRIVIKIPLHCENDPAKLGILPDAMRDVIGQIADSHFDQALLIGFASNAAMFEIILHSTKGEALVRDQVRHEAIVAAMAYLRREKIGLSFEAVPPQALSEGE